MVIQLRKDCLDSLSEAFVSPCRRSPGLLPVWDIKGNASGFKQIQLHGSTQIALVSQIVQSLYSQLHILKILQVMHISCNHVMGEYESADAI